MNYALLIVVISGANIFGSVVGLVASRFWMLESGINFFTNRPMIVGQVSIIGLFLVILCFFLLYFSRTLIFGITGTIIAVVVLGYHLYYAIIWTVNPGGFFTGMKDTWELFAGTERAAVVQKYFRCCGFSESNEFRAQCRESKTRTCLDAMKNQYLSHVRGMGAFGLAQATSIIVLICFLVLASKHFGTRPYANRPRGMC